MIGYLKGTIASVQKTGTRVVLTIDVNQVGYDVQIVPRLLQQLPAVGEPMQVFTHYQVREDQVTLFGFGAAAERDLFRQLVSVSGIGPQLAVALLDTLGLQDLVQAIVSGPRTANQTSRMATAGRHHRLSLGYANAGHPGRCGNDPAGLRLHQQRNCSSSASRWARHNPF
jgi:hypothetical protein